MIKSVIVKFDKILHDTGRAILISVNEKENWIPKKLCRNLVINKKLGGNVCIPTFFAEKIGFEISESNAGISIIHHVPEKMDKTKIIHDKSLFK